MRNFLLLSAFILSAFLALPFNATAKKVSLELNPTNLKQPGLSIDHGPLFSLINKNTIDIPAQSFSVALSFKKGKYNNYLSCTDTEQSSSITAPEGANTMIVEYKKVRHILSRNEEFCIISFK